MHWMIKSVLITATLVALFAIGQVDQNRLTTLEAVKARGEIVLVTQNSPTTYFEDRDHQTGFELDLARRFANFLDVRLRIEIADSLEEMLLILQHTPGAFVAPGFAVNNKQLVDVLHSTPYIELTQQVVYRKGSLRPRSVEQLQQGSLLVSSQSEQSNALRNAQNAFPELSWQEGSNIPLPNLLELVSKRKIKYTVVNSNEFQLVRSFYPDLGVAFDLGAKQNLSWLFAKRGDQGFLQASKDFFKTIKQDGTLVTLNQHYFGQTSQLNFDGAIRFLRKVKRHLPKYEEQFKNAAIMNNLNWHLLAAMSYQESHLNPNAKSYTGVRGLMMLTKNTAKELGIKNRLDPQQSIEGGARYISKLRKRLKHVQEPDRTWMALAAYNVGFGHLKDAQKLAKKKGLNPKRWDDVKKTLPLLSQKRYYKKTQHGYARGMEPVKYVKNIRRYNDILSWQQARTYGVKGRTNVSIPQLAFTTVPPRG